MWGRVNPMWLTSLWKGEVWTQRQTEGWWCETQEEGRISRAGRTWAPRSQGIGLGQTSPHNFRGNQTGFQASSLQTERWHISAVGALGLWYLSQQLSWLIQGVWTVHSLVRAASLADPTGCVLFVCCWGELSCALKTPLNFCGVIIRWLVLGDWTYRQWPDDSGLWTVAQLWPSQEAKPHLLPLSAQNSQGGSVTARFQDPGSHCPCRTNWRKSNTLPRLVTWDAQLPGSCL